MNTDSALTAYSALSQSTRLAVLRLLLKHEPTGLTVGEIGGHFSLAPATLSFHLKTLRDAGLVNAQRRGRRICYRAELPQIRAMNTFLLSECCQGEPERCVA